MRVAIFIPAFENGGVERSMIRLSRGLVELDCEVDFLVAHTNSRLMDMIPDTVRVVRLFTPRLPSIPRLVSRRHWTSFGVLPSLVRYLRKTKPDAILAAQALTTAAMAKKMARSKARLVMRQAVNQTLWTQTDPYRLSKIAPMIKNRAFGSADWIVAISEGVAQDLRTNYPGVRDRVSVIYNPAADDHIVAEAKNRSDLHPWLAEKSVPVAIAVGRLTAQKDFETLLRAFAIVRTSMNSKLVIIGEGEDRQPLELLARSLGIENDVSMPGFSSNPWASMAEADVLVCSSAWEGLGNILIEAMALGTPVISTDCPSGPREILKDGELGPLVPVGDHEALAEVWLKTLSNPDEARSTAARALTYIGRFTIEGVSKQYLDVLKAS